MIRKVLEFLKKNARTPIYILVVLAIFIYAIFMRQPFKEENHSYVECNAETIATKTNMFVKGDKIVQTFITDDDNLKTIGIKTITQNGVITAKIDIEIKEKESQKIIYSGTLPLSTVKDDEYFQIEFDKQKDSKGKEYELTITSVDGTELNAVMWWLSLNDEKTGEIYSYNGNIVPDNKLMLSFEYFDEKIYFANVMMWIIVFIITVVAIKLIKKSDEKAFLIIALFVGIVFVFTTTFPHELDEGVHFFRALLISQGDFYDTVEDDEIGGYVSKDFWNYAASYMTLKKLAVGNWEFGELFSEDKQFMGIKYFSSTVPIGHSIPAIGLVIANILNLSAMLPIYLARLCCLAFYITCAYFAIKNMKYYKSVMFTVATLPMALYLAGSISLDPIINGACMLFISICLKYYFDVDEETYITKKDIALLIVMAILIITNKYLTYSPLVLLFFLIPQKKFKTKKAYKIMIITSIIIGILCVLWQVYMLQAFPYEEDRIENVDQIKQLEFVISSPIYVWRILSDTVMGLSKIHSNLHVQTPIGFIGDLTGLILVIAALLEANKMPTGKRRKILTAVLATMFIVVLSISVFALYLSFSPLKSQCVSGYQMRYTIPLLILILIPFANMINIKNESKNYERNLALFMLAVNIDSLLAILLDIFKV